MRIDPKRWMYLNAVNRKKKKLNPYTSYDIRVATGNPANLAGGDGEIWYADTIAPGNSYLTNAGSNNTTNYTSVGGKIVDGTVPAHVPVVLFDYERADSAGTMTYTFPVPDAEPGQVTVNALVQEIFFTATGQREWTLNVNGSPVFANYDPFRDIPNRKVGHMLTSTGHSPNGSGNIVITWTSIINNPNIYGLWIVTP